MGIGGMDVLFDVIPFLIMAVFVIVIGMFAVVAVQSISKWNRNNQSPRLTVEAAVVTKRGEVSHHRRHNADGMDHVSTSTTYYVTFQVASGDRMEFHVSGREYGILVEGDRGELTFQGTRYLNFQRGN